MEAGADDQGGVKRCCSVMQGWDQKSQDPPGVRSGEEYEGQKELEKYINNRRKVMENMSLPLSEVGHNTTNDMEKANILNAFFISVFSLYRSSSPSGKKEVQSQEFLSSVKND